MFYKYYLLYFYYYYLCIIFGNGGGKGEERGSSFSCGRRGEWWLGRIIYVDVCLGVGVCFVVVEEVVVFFVWFYFGVVFVVLVGVY